MRFDVQRCEVISSDKVNINGLGLAIDRKTAGPPEITDDVGENGACLGLQIFQLRNGKICL